MVSYLWDDARGAMFDRDKNHNQMPTLIHNTLRCMYWHSLRMLWRSALSRSTC